MAAAGKGTARKEAPVGRPVHRGLGFVGARDVLRLLIALLASLRIEAIIVTPSANIDLGARSPIALVFPRLY
jgi:hypothetical protein